MCIRDSVKTALEQVRGKDFETLCEMIKRTAFKVTRVGQLVAQEASRRLGVKFGIVDLSLAPTPAIGDSLSLIHIYTRFNAGMSEGQTRQTQNLLWATTCGFKSHCRH